MLTCYVTYEPSNFTASGYTSCSSNGSVNLGFRHGLQSRLFLLCPQVVAFMKSPVGRYLDRHPFVALTVLLFIAMSAVPVGFFLLIVVLTSLAALVGVILLEGILLICSPPQKMIQLGAQYLLGTCHSYQMFLFWKRSQ